MLTVESFVQTATKEQKKLLKKLKQYVEKEKMLERQIKDNNDFMMKEPDNIFLLLQYYYNKSARTGEYEEDSFTSRRLKEKLRLARRRIRGYLAEAVVMGMKELDIVQINYKQYTGKSLY